MKFDKPQKIILDKLEYGKLREQLGFYEGCFKVAVLSLVLLFILYFREIVLK